MGKAQTEGTLSLLYQLISLRSILVKLLDVRDWIGYLVLFGLVQQGIVWFDSGYLLYCYRPCFGCFSPELVETVNQYLDQTDDQSNFFTVDSNFIGKLLDSTVCPGSSDPFYISSLLYKMGHYFLDILYVFL